MCCEKITIKNALVGIAIFAFGALWYLSNIGFIASKTILPVLIMLIGVVLIALAFFKGKPEAPKRRRR
jgi:hypothetical protein